MPPRESPAFPAVAEDNRDSIVEPLLSKGDGDYGSINISNDSDTLHDHETANLSRNVRLILIYTWFVAAGRSIWSQNVLAAFVYFLQSGSPEAVGYITAVMGLSQLIVSFPSGILADKYRRDTLLRVASKVGIVAIAITLSALYYEDYRYLVVALAVWGTYWGITNTSVSALFADSIKQGQRAYYFTQRSTLISLGNVMGPFVALLMFASLGDRWTIRDCSLVMAVGQAVCFPAILLLRDLNDDDALPRSEQESLVTNEGDLLTSRVQDESVDETIFPTRCPCVSRQRLVPTLVALSDATAGFSSGMSVRYIAIFLCDNLRLSPVKVQVVYILSPLMQALLMNIAQHLAKKFGRCHVAASLKWTGVLLMLSMVFSYLRGFPWWVICIFVVLRSAFMNSTNALTRSVVMDNVPKGERAKWSALESLNMFSWSGSAALGGILVAYKGIIFNFYITALLQLLATIPLIVVFPLDNIETSPDTRLAGESV